MLGSLFGAKSASSAQAAANRTNIQLAKENREFQERMSSTALQRSAKDAEAAGLNRILALGKPATTPAGNVATVQSTKSHYPQVAAQMANTALTATRQIAEIKNIEAQTNQTDENTKLIKLKEIGQGYGNTIASWAAGIVDTVNALTNNMTPEQKAKWIKTQISKASSWLTDQMEKFGGTDTSPGWQDRLTIQILDATMSDYDPNKATRSENRKQMPKEARINQLVRQGWSRKAATNWVNSNEGMK